MFLLRGSRKRVVVNEWTVWEVVLGWSPWSAELASEREDSDTRLSGIGNAVSTPFLSVRCSVGCTEYWDFIDGTGGGSLVRRGASSDMDFRVRFLRICPLFELASSDFAGAAARRNRPVRFILDVFFCNGSISAVGAVVMMWGARRHVS